MSSILFISHIMTPHIHDRIPYSLNFSRTKIFVVYQISVEKVIFVIKISWIGYPLPNFCLKRRVYESSMSSSAIVMYSECT